LPRRLGQHFLVRESVLEKLAVAACGEHTSRAIEIGPGRGALTRKLLARVDELHAVELDPGLVEHLGRVFTADPKLHLHAGDVLTTDLAQWGPAAIAGNLPYYITSPIIEKFLKLDHQFPVAVFLLQSEVAQRLIASPGTRDYGYLTVVTRLICDVELVCQVPPAAFSPPPKVNSAGVRLIRKPQHPVRLDSLRTLISRSFAHKRKTLRNNLRPFYGPDVDSLPEAQLRAEQLSIDAFIDLHSRLSPGSEVH
jgi:16S rRNA (adenine1518-N6/adenine1519-N6)-dimethyltransferase